MIPWRNFRRFFSKVFKQPGYAVSVSLKRTRAYWSYKFGAGKAALPEAITLFLTHRCNLSCKMCGQWGESGVTRKQDSGFIREELLLEQLKGIIDDVSGFKPNITLFGGEPLLYSGCMELIRYIKEKNMHCLIITNGSMLSEFAERLVEAGLDELNVSLDGARALHDEIRGMPGLFDRTAGGLKEIKSAKEHKNSRKPLINLQCTITRYNYKHLEQLIKVAQDVGADSITYHNLIFLDRGLIDKQKETDVLLNCSSSDWEGFVFKPEIDPDILHAKMSIILAGKYPFSVDFYPNLSLEGLRQYYNNPSYCPSEYPARCISPWVVAYVFPDGEVRPCLNSTYSYGNIKLAKFTALWNGGKAVKFRNFLKEKNVFPACVRCTELYRY